MVDTSPFFLLTEQLLDIGSVSKAVQLPHCGAVNLFVGTVRNRTAERSVLYLDYEAYTPMALAVMQDIAMRARMKWQSIEAIALHHRVGRVYAGDIAVVLAVSSPHRTEIFMATDWIMSEVKSSVPIWKKEVYHDGAVWVSAHA